jgi:hypothetical protein
VLPSSNEHDDIIMTVATVTVNIRSWIQYPLFLPQTALVVTVCPYNGKKKFEKEGEALISFFRVRL